MSRLFLIYAILCAAFFSVTLAGVPLNNFYRFGKDHGDKETRRTVSPERIYLEPPFQIFGKLRDYLTVFQSSGSIIFSGGAILPYASRASWRYFDMGTAFYRQSNEEVDLDKARREIGSAFPAFQDIDFKWVVIGTWKQIGDSDYKEALNTFQAILTTDGVRTFVIYNYNETKSWTDKATWAVFKLTHDKKEYIYKIEVSNTTNMTTMENGSNVNKPGKWVFRIDLPKIYEPSSMCAKPPQPVNGFCKTNEYVPDSEARCGCNLGFSLSSLKIYSLKCMLDPSSTYNWRGNIPVCRSLAQGDSQNSTAAQTATNTSNNISAPLLSTDICSKVTCPLHQSHKMPFVRKRPMFPDQAPIAPVCQTTISRTQALTFIARFPKTAICFGTVKFQFVRSTFILEGLLSPRMTENY